ncbi:hypothetical protein CAEBREN_20600 [Caenorhabditis brenneri]|uniref:Uncharacterized protein n=1 Tax=Caenorhabditis brenneri TaxID=135651 RepID=G0MH01_CAEBE|nr:hypothetical protein CAEBREN_20600 [Caenorhabditis brenneri]
MKLLLSLALFISILAIHGMPLLQEEFGEDDDTITDLRGFHLVDNDRLLSAYPTEIAQRVSKLRALPVMKRSNVFGRWGFRAGNREDDVAGFGGFHLVNENRFLAANPIENALRLAELRALPIMKKSNAFGRWGFRPGKRDSVACSF